MNYRPRNPCWLWSCCAAMVAIVVGSIGSLWSPWSWGMVAVGFILGYVAVTCCRE